MTIKEFNDLFTDDEQYIRLYDLANDDEILFENQIEKMPNKFEKYKVILLETMEEEFFDGFLGVYIATKDEDFYYDKYHD